MPSGQCAATLATRASALLAVHELAHELGRERERLSDETQGCPKGIFAEDLQYISVYISIYRYISVYTSVYIGKYIPLKTPVSVK